MSRVYFRSPSGEAVLRGAERAWCSSIVDRLGRGALGEYGPWGEQAKHVRSLVNPSHSLVREFSDAMSPAWWRAFRAATTGIMSEDILQWQGNNISTFSLNLNTALLLGNDTVKLMAFLHGQCEIHGYVMGEDRAWYAQKIREGRATGLLRADMGWEELVQFLLSNENEPVVTSYSVTDQFPNMHIAQWTPDVMPGTSEDDEYDVVHDMWSELPLEKRWSLAFAGLTTSDRGLRWCPESFATQKFGHELSFFDLLAPDVLDRIERAFA